MIYFFDNELNMVKVATSKNVISAVHEHELNGLILGTVEADLRYTEAFINDVDYFGYYYKDNYYLHKIKRVEHEHENELVRITGRHIFFEDMLFGDYIRDVRPVNRDALHILNQTISANTRWQTVMTDTSKLHSETYYWVPPMEVLNDLTKNVGIEYEPKILFDGQNINGFQLHVANRIGEDTPIRVPFGSRVLNLKYEVDYSEIVTALYGHGKGEEVGDGYGRRINFRDIVFRRNGVVSLPGQLYMENPNVTAQYGKDDGSPKFGRVIFEDIESASQLAIATYEAYMEQSRPKMLFEASVVDLGDVGMGDGVLIIRREYDVYFNARIHKLSVDLLYPEDAQVELGDYEHFKESKVQRKTRESNNQYRRETSSRIQQLKEQFNDRFDGEVAQWKAEYDQALIDVHAEIEADRENMTNLIEGTRTEFTDNLNTEITQSKDYAEQQAQAKADSVQSNLDSFKDSHQQLYDEVTGNLSQTRSDLLERINNIDTQSFNLIRGSRLDETDRYKVVGGTVHVDEDLPYFRYGLGDASVQYLFIVDDIQFEAGKTYTLSLDYRTSNDVSIDYLHIIPTDGSADINIRNNITESDMAGIIPDGEWHRAFLTFTVPRNLTGNLRIGSDFTNGTKDQIDIRLPYLTTSGNTQWVFHPSDSYESIMSIMTRLDEFEARVQDDLAGVSGELSTARSELQQQLDDAKAELEGLEVGGRNLIPNSVTPVKGIGELEKDVSTPFGLNDVYLYPTGFALLRYEVSPFTPSVLEQYTFSVYMKTKNQGDIAEVRIDVSDEPQSTENYQINDEWQRISSKTTKLDKGRLHADITLFTNDTPVYIAFWQLEIGNMMTPWTPAPEDIEEKITTLSESIEYIDGQLEAKLNRTEIEPLQNKITEYGTTLDANAESIGLLQEKTQLHDDDIEQWSNQSTSTAEEVSRILTHNSEQDDLITSVTNESRETAEGLERTISRVSETESGIESAKLAIESNADAVALRLTKNEFEGATAGMSGRNLLLNTPTEETEFNFSGWNGNTWRVSDYLKDEMVAGGDFTASIDFKDIQTTHSVGLVITFRNNSGGAVRQLLKNDEFYQTGDEGRYIYSLNIPPITGDVAYVEVSLRNGASGEVSSGIMSRLMLNKGIKALPYSPAPEDIRADITQLNTDINIEAGKIETLISKTELHDGDITQWSNETKANAESISQTLTRVEETEAGISQAKTDIQTNADGVAGVIRDVETIDGNLSSLTTEFNVEAGKVETLISKTDGHDTQLTNIVADYEKIEQTVVANDEWLGTHGSNVLQTVDGFEQKVWMSDIASIGANLIPQSANAWENGGYFSTGGNNDSYTERIRLKRDYPIALSEGEDYTFSCDSSQFSGIRQWMLIQFRNGEFVDGSTTYILRRDNHTFTAQGNELLILAIEQSNSAAFPHHIENPDKRIFIKLEQGSTATPMLNAISQIEQLANSVAIRAQELDGEYLSQSDLQITPNYWQLGSMRIGAENVSSVLRGSPDALDAVVSEFNLTGNLNANGQITSLAVDAIEGNFARLFSSELTANVITSDHIQVGTALVDKMFATSARIDELITKTHFVNEMHALTLNVVELNASEIRARLLTANTIEAEWLKGGTALIDRLFSSTAMFERMMAKNGFVNTLNTVSLHANSFSSSYPGSNREITMENGRAKFKYGSIEIQTSSGRRVIIDGSINRSSSMTQRMPAFMSSEVTVDGSWYRNNSSNHQVAHTEYYMHEARHLLVGVALNRWGYAGQGAYARMSTRGITSQSFSVATDGSHYGWLEIDLGEPLDRPTTGEVQISFRKSHSDIAGAVRLHLSNRYVTDYPDNR